MRLQLYSLSPLCAAIVLAAGCSAPLSQGAMPGSSASKGAAQSAIGPLGSHSRALLYVANTFASKRFPGVTVYPQSGIAQRKIRSITEDVDYPTGLAVDTSDNLYVGNLGNSTVTVYPPGSKAPSETLTEASAPYGVAVGRDGTVYVAEHNAKTPSILVYPKGHTTPSKTIAIAHGVPFELALDSFGNLYVTVGDAVYQFKPGSSKGKNLGLQGLAGFLTGIAFDKQNKLLVLDNHKRAREVFVYPYGAIHPSEKIAISSVSSAIGIAINSENSEIWVTTASDSTVQGISYPSGIRRDVLFMAGLTTGVAVSPASND
jgi:DNA-binding beta-propeller fold protein YncE